MSAFEIDISKCQKNSSELNSINTELKTVQSNVEKVLNALTQIEFLYVNSNLKNTYNSIEKVHLSVESLHTALKSVISTYQKTENQISSNKSKAQETANQDKLPDFKNIKTYVDFLMFLALHHISPGTALFYLVYEWYKAHFGAKEYSIESDLYDDVGSYGGDQGDMVHTYGRDPERTRELLQDIRHYFPNMTQAQAYKYLERLNNTGCAYTALANTIFMHYEGKEAEFEQTFGYPMYKNGDLNYDRLILDLYATTDIAGINDDVDGLPKGISVDNTQRIMDNFLSDKGISVDVKTHQNVTVNNFKKISESGGIVTAHVYYDNIYDENGNPHYLDGGHRMVVTGVTDDGRFIVSSWGEKYYIKPSELDHDDSFSIMYY